MKFPQLGLVMAAGLVTAQAALAPMNAADCGQMEAACEVPNAESCPIGGTCGKGPKDSLAGAAFGAAMIGASVWWKRRAK